MLTVLTHLWAQPGGRTRYTAHHVNIWADMVDRHLTMPHELACVTDMPGGIDSRVRIIAPPRDFEDVVIPSWPNPLPQCLRRLSMYRPDAAEVYGTERFVNMDLDCVVAKSLDPLFDRPEDIVLYRGGAKIRPYNGSMTMMTAGCRPQVFTTFDAEAAERASRHFQGSDQAWVSHVLGFGEAVWTSEDDGVVSWSMRRRTYDPETTRLLFFPCPEKPWHAAEKGDPFVCEHYHRDMQGRCLILGYAPSVWEEAIAAGSDFDAVIASPEAARHREAPGWRWGEVDAIAENDDHAERLARMMGYRDVVFCGRQPAATEERAA